MKVNLVLPDNCVFVHMVCIVDDKEKGIGSFMAEFDPKTGETYYFERRRAEDENS